MNPSLRKVLIDTHIAGIAIALLLIWALGVAFQGLGDPLVEMAEFLATAVAIRGLPYVSYSRNEHYKLILALLHICWALIDMGVAWLLSRWVFGVGPIRALDMFGARLPRRRHV